MLSDTTASAGAELTGIAGWAVDVMTALGGIGAAALIALENLFPPLPSEVILPLAGFAAGTGAELSLISAILWCTAGSVVGAWILYGLGAWLGRERALRLLTRLPLVNAHDITRTESWFLHHGSWTVFLGRMIPVFRSLISLPAGVTRMHPLRFTLLTAAGSAIWNSVLITAGYTLGANWSIVGDYVGVFSRVVAIAVGVVALYWVFRRWRVLRRWRSVPQHSDAPPQGQNSSRPAADADRAASPTH
ncbi:DedA family protein [Actinobaculum sp. 352]|nr:hypothetical protein DDD63_11170 [Actinobaculum sp. 313]RTE49922.1 DedA family protein [Actinobaculum sp. 352]